MHLISSHHLLLSPFLLKCYCSVLTEQWGFLVAVTWKKTTRSLAFFWSRSLALLESRGVNLDCIVTDRHPQVQKFLRERNITHYYNVWHWAKGILSVLKWSWLTAIVQYTIQNLSFLMQPFPFFKLLVISFWWEWPDGRFFWSLCKYPIKWKDLS